MFSLWIVALLLLTPINGYYNLPIVLFPALARSLADRPAPRLTTALLLGTALLWVPPGWAARSPALDTALRIGWGTLLLGAFVATSLRAAAPQILRRRWGAVALAIAIAVAPATSLNLQLGQLGLLMAALLAGVYLAQRRHPAVAALLLSLACLLKLYPALLGLLVYFAVIALRLRALSGRSERRYDPPAAPDP